MRALLALLALAVVSPASAYVLVTTAGHTIQIVGPPSEEDGRLLVVFDGGRRSSIDAATIDGAATRRANAGTLAKWRELYWWKDLDAAGSRRMEEEAPRLGDLHPGGLAKASYSREDLPDEELDGHGAASPAAGDLERQRAALRGEYVRIGKMLEALDARASALGTAPTAPAPSTGAIQRAPDQELPLVPPLLTPLRDEPQPRPQP